MILNTQQTFQLFYSILFFILVANGFVVLGNVTAVHKFSLLHLMKQNCWSFFDGVTVVSNLCLLGIYNMSRTEAVICWSNN
jgi:hypothetical protein